MKFKNKNEIQGRFQNKEDKQGMKVCGSKGGEIRDDENDETRG